MEGDGTKTPRASCLQFERAEGNDGQKRFWRADISRR